MPWKHRLPRSLGLERNPKVNHSVNLCRALRRGHPVFAWTLPVKRLVTCVEQFFHLEQHDGWKFIMLNRNLSSCNFHQFFLILPQVTKSHSHTTVRITWTNAQVAGCLFLFSFFLEAQLLLHHSPVGTLPMAASLPKEWSPTSLISTSDSDQYLSQTSALFFIAIFVEAFISFSLVCYLYICQLPEYMSIPLWHPYK